MEGEGVAPIKDKKLEKLAEDFIENRDTKAKLAEELTGVETKIFDRMTELKITQFRFADQIVTIKPGKNHIKIKTVKGEAETE